jgi:NAD(P)H-hydrate epimerase
VDISLPPPAQSGIGVDGYLIDGEMIRSFFKTRPADAHKGTFGTVAVIAGSSGKTGAATMTTLAALKIGAGLVTLVIPASLNPIVASKLTEATTYPVDDGGKGFFTPSTFDAIRDFVADKDVLVIGPGLGQEEETKALVRRLYTEIDKPFVVDADGINAFEGHRDLLPRKGHGAILTPHPGEFGRLVGKSPKEVNNDRLESGHTFAESHKVSLVLKGSPTAVFSSEGDIYINPTGNPALSKGGTGDVLTGFIGGLVSQRYSMIEASVFGVYLHGYIADTWAEEETDMDLLAGDLIAGSGKAIRAIRYGTDRIYVEKSL